MSKSITGGQILHDSLIPGEVGMARIRGGGHGKLFNYDGISVLEDEKILEIIGGDGYTTMLMYLIPLNKYIKKWLNLMLHMPIIIKTKRRKRKGVCIEI